MADTPDLKELMRMAQEMQKSMKEAHDQLSTEEYVGEAGGGLVKVVMNGSHDTKKVVLSPNIRNEELEVIADLLAAANNAANREIQRASERKMFDLTKKLGIPGQGGKEGTE